ncbi:piggyBac transposable element-derived protein 4-like [Stegodyphus dumicola]|uniref:piggyBac transposable element-derived protein 4-like n=1 Tax=Stegodyphus dumicola TaxID=202533 RepID=UPI0015AF9775|nr:piggyBac transposable element-derived protein 4-like [Stegodyphus dumicola]XP_035219648.1 piggyBac transposable element-derived protein 4-like [Stegodyphus dumicola]
MAEKCSESFISAMESSDDDFQFEMNDDSASSDDGTESSYESDTADRDTVLPKRRKIMKIENFSEDDESEKEWHSEEIESVSGKWEEVADDDDVPFMIYFTTFPRTPGPQISENLTEPIDFFKLYFTDVLIDGIVKETNEYAKRKIGQKHLSKRSIWHSWEDVTHEEFLAFLGVILNMGTMPLADIQEYWSTNYTSRIPFFSDVFTRGRFQQIFWMLHLKTENIEGRNITNPVQKCNSFLQYIDSKFMEHFMPGKDICVNEAVIKCTGKMTFMPHNPNKPTNRGMRIFVVTDAETGYVYSILPYYGSVTTEDNIKPELPVSSRIPLHFIKKLLDNNSNAEGYHLYTDKYFTSIPLAEELLKMKCHLTGTIKTNRRYLPSTIKEPKFSENNMVAYRRNNMLLLAWKEKEIVTLLTTCGSAEMKTIKKKVRGGTICMQKPQVVINYTAKMRAVDRIGQYAATYCFLRKSLKYWRKFFFWGVNMCAFNSYILYKTTKAKSKEKPLTHLKFVKLLVHNLVYNFRRDNTFRTRSLTSHIEEGSEERLNNKLHIIRWGPKKKDCAVCSNRKIQGGRREVRTYCDTCTRKPGLHIGDCFEKYHTLQDYKN